MVGFIGASRSSLSASCIVVHSWMPVGRVAPPGGGGVAGRHARGELWWERGRVRLAGGGPAQALRLGEIRGGVSSPPLGKPPVAAESELPPCSPEELHDIATRFRLLLEER